MTQPGYHCGQLSKKVCAKFFFQSFTGNMHFVRKFSVSTFIVVSSITKLSVSTFIIVSSITKFLVSTFIVVSLITKFGFEAFSFLFIYHLLLPVYYFSKISFFKSWNFFIRFLHNSQRDLYLPQWTELHAIPAFGKTNLIRWSFKLSPISKPNLGISGITFLRFPSGQSKMCNASKIFLTFLKIG